MAGIGQLAFEAVACRRGGRLLFKQASFDLKPGDAMMVTGPNGVGKSSLLRVAAGLLEPFAGRVTSGGGVALSDERPALDPELTLERALGFWARIDGGDVGAALTAVDMAHIAPVPVRMLSTGQRRRASVARVIASNPAVWLLDEPANGLDVASITRLEAAIAAHRAGGGIVVAASHQPLAMLGAQTLELAALVEDAA